MSAHDLPQSMRIQDMATVSFELTETALSALNLPPFEAGRELRMAAAAKLYELGRLSSGAAADLAGVPRVEFLTKLGSYGVDTFTDTEDELGKDADSA